MGGGTSRFFGGGGARRLLNETERKGEEESVIYLDFHNDVFSWTCLDSRFIKYQSLETTHLPSTLKL